ncbi:MAG: peptidase M14, partial [Ectothiorhodospiraceae bacterium]|nr:peptidase M14 [Ectothiorhodospiraceae bacterium]
LDGDGVFRNLSMRADAGDFVESASHPGLMLPRRVEDPPPYWRLYPEGVIEHWDGHTIPEPELLRGTPDFNRNFPWSWRPEPHQAGAGDYPGSEPETQAVMAFAVAHPNLYAWLNLHTFGGVFIRPAQDVPDTRMDQADLGVYRQLAVWGERHPGYPTVSGYEEFTYEPDKPLHGDLTDFAYHQRGCLAEVCELWGLFRHLALPTPRRFVDHYTALSRSDMGRLADWDERRNAGRIFQPWAPLEHPQLGAVEIGGHDPRVGIWNPPPEKLPTICDSMSAYWLLVASLLPRLSVEALDCVPLGENHQEIRISVANHGYLPTNGISAGREAPWNTPGEANYGSHGCDLLEPLQRGQTLGHLDGWGRGLGQASQMPWFQHSSGSDNRARASWIVRGTGTVTIKVGSPRLGYVERCIPVPASS